MILLHRLYAHNFKHLTDVSLHFPASGTVLVEGSNEAGKSSLFEAVFFALYGRALLSDRDYPIADLRRYGEDALHVELDFSISGRMFSLTRRVGKSHTAKLVCPTMSPDGSSLETESMTSRSEIRKRIAEELRLSPEALLNTCFVEQKRLERLEDLDANARRATINELLNLRVLTELENEFKIVRADYDALQALRERVEIARIDQELPLLKASVESARCALHLAHLQQNEQRLGSLAEQVEQAGQLQNKVQAQRDHVAAALDEIVSLKARLKAIDSDLSLRAHAWQAALNAQDQAAARVEELQHLAAALPERERQMSRWQDWLSDLRTLEELESEAARLHLMRQETQQHIAHHQQVHEQWEEGQKRAAELDTARLQEVGRLGEAEDKLAARQHSRRRISQLPLLMQNITSYQQAAIEAEELSQQVDSARASASELPDLCARLQNIEAAMSRLSQFEDNTRALGHVQSELAAAQRRQAEAHLLASKRADLDAQQEQAQHSVEAAVLSVAKSTRQSVVGVALAVTGACVAITGALLQLNFLVVAGLMILGCGAMLLIQSRAAVKLARNEHARALSTRSMLEGERRAVAATTPVDSDALQELEQQIGALNAEHERLSAGMKTLQDFSPHLEQWRTATPEELRNALQATQHEIAVGRAASATISDIEQRRAGKAQQSQEELARAEAIAAELNLSSDDPTDWLIAAEHEQVALTDESTALPDSSLLQDVERVRAAIAGIDRERTMLESEQQQRQVELQKRPLERLSAELERHEHALAENIARRLDLESVSVALEADNLPSTAAALETHLAVVRHEVERDQQRSGELASAQAYATQVIADVTAKRHELEQAWASVLGGQSMASTVAQTLEQLSLARATTEQRLGAMEESQLRADDSRLERQCLDLDRQLATLRHQHEEKTKRRVELLSEMDMGADEPLEKLAMRCPEFLPTQHGPEDWQRILQDRQDAERESRMRRDARAHVLGIGSESLQVETEEEALASGEKRLAVRRRAGEIVQQTRRSIVSRVMPLTMQNMRQLLPLLTESRYQDVQWDEENNYLAVYDNQARDFVRKRVFSGGARDQISLALRLAFALATLPGEHNIRPGWLFLDEPLSSFDRSRTQALVDLLTRGLIRRQFAQIFLVSHSESFDPAQFDYRLRLDAGRIVESSLPDV